MNITGPALTPGPSPAERERGATVRVAPTGAVAGPLAIPPCTGGLKGAMARMARTLMMVKVFAFMVDLLFYG